MGICSFNPVCPFLSALRTAAPPASQASNTNYSSLTSVHPSTYMKQRKSICFLCAKGTNPFFGGGSISSLLVSATGTNKTTEPNKFTKSDDSSALVISWATEPGWVPHYISQDAFSSKKRINKGGFSQVQEEAVLQGFQYTHTKKKK